MDIYTIILDVNGGTYIDQKICSSPEEAFLAWSRKVNNLVLSAFNNIDIKDFEKKISIYLEADDEKIVPIKGLESVWFVSIEVNEIHGFINIVRTK